MKILLVHKVLMIKHYNNIYLLIHIEKNIFFLKTFITKAALNVMYMIKIYK